MQRSSGGCLTAALVGFSRFFLLFAWIARPIAFERVFSGSFIIPCLGILFLPFTTLMYVIMVTNGVGTGLSGIDWLWMFLAFLVDVSYVALAGAANRDRIPQGVPGAVTPPPASPPPAAPAVQ